jgi:hypothetical protein
VDAGNARFIASHDPNPTSMMRIPIVKDPMAGAAAPTVARQAANPALRARHE